MTMWKCCGNICVQIRELYQSLIAVQQNQVMSILTVVTTIFLPLTLIVGWYGMNFEMPEYAWRYGYFFRMPAFCCLHCGHYHLFQAQEMVLMYTENGHL